MKQQIRKSVFETNSSSTHAMAIQSFPNILYGIYTNMTDEQIDKFNDDDETKEGWQCKIIKKKDLPAVVTFHEGEFGWGIRTIKSDDYETKASYLYTLMSESLSYDEFDEIDLRLTVIKPLETIILELLGMQALFQELDKLITLICKLQGLLELKNEEDFMLFRRTIFECCGLIDKIKIPL